jgi:hypothetical protein
MEVPTWPSGVVRFDGQTLEWGAGELHRVAVTSLLKVEIKPPKKGRLNLKIKFQAGLGTTGTGAWVEQQHEAALSELVAAVHAAAPVTAP